MSIVRRSSPVSASIGSFAAICLLDAFSAPVWADACGRPALYWAGGGDFTTPSAIQGLGSTNPCGPAQSTDNVTFGASGYVQGGTVNFPAGSTANTLLVDTSGFTFNFASNTTLTQGIVFGLVTLTITGGNLLSTEAGGGLGGTTLIIPDNSGVSASTVGVQTLQMTGGGSVTVQGGTTDAGANITNVNLTNSSSIQETSSGGTAFTDVAIGSGTIDHSFVSVSPAAGNVLLLSAGAAGQNLTITDGSTVTAGQLYLGYDHTSQVTVTGIATSVTATATTLFGPTTLSNAANFSSGVLNVATGAGATLAVQSGAQLASTSATVSGSQLSAPAPDVIVTDPSSLWTVHGPLNITDGSVLVTNAGQLEVSGGSLDLSTTSPIPTTLSSTLTVTGQNSRLNVSGNATIGDNGTNAGPATLSLQPGATGLIGGNLIIANLANSLGEVDLAGAGTTLGVTGTVTVGQAGVGTMNITAGAVLDPSSVTIGAVVPAAGGGMQDPTTNLHTQNVSTVTLSGGGQLQTADLTVGSGGYGALNINDATVTSSGNGLIADQAGSEGNVILNDPAALWQANTLKVGGTGNGWLQINLGTVTTSSDLTVGDQAGSKGNLTVGGGGNGTLTVAGNFIVGNQGAGTAVLDPSSTLTVAGTTTLGAQTGGNGKLTLSGGSFSLGDTVIVGAGGTGALRLTLGATNGAGGETLTTPYVVLGEQQGSSGNLSLDGAGTSFEVSALTVGSFGLGKVALTNNAVLTSDGAVRVGDQVTTQISGITVDTGSRFVVNGPLTVGGASIATLALTNGGNVTSVGNLTLGDATASTGIVTVSSGTSGVSSTVNYGSAFIIGNNGTGTVTLTSGGVVAPTSTGTGIVEVSANAGNTSTVSISGTDATSGLASRLLASEVAVGGTTVAAGGTGTITVGAAGLLDASSSLTLWSHGTLTVSGGGAVTVGSGPQAAAGTVQIDSGGALHGSGTIHGHVVNAGGVVSPGDPVTLNIDGDYTQTGGVLDLQIAGAGPGESDMLAATGNIDITGGTVDLEFIDGYQPTVGEELELFSAAGVTLNDDLIEIDGAAPTFAFTTMFDSATGTYGFTDMGGTPPPPPPSVPEPPVSWLALIALGLYGAVRRRSPALAGGGGGNRGRLTSAVVGVDINDPA